MMRAKFRIHSVESSPNGGINDGPRDVIRGNPVCSSPFAADGSSEDNTYALYSPSGMLELTITNPALCGKIKQGDTFYVDFTPAT